MTEVGQRQPRIECPAFLAFVRRRPCCACGAPAPSQAAHVRMGCPTIGKRNAGIGEKPSDRWAVPLCADCHLDAPDAQHRVGERAFWARVGIDPFALATKLYAQFERRQNRTPEQRERVVKRAASVKRAKVRQEKRKLVTGIQLRGRLSALTSSRPIQNANRWPPKGSRKLRSRP